jgi:hypothetical protein
LQDDLRQTVKHAPLPSGTSRFVIQLQPDTFVYAAITFVALNGNRDGVFTDVKKFQDSERRR